MYAAPDDVEDSFQRNCLYGPRFDSKNHDVEYLFKEAQIDAFMTQYNASCFGKTSCTIDLVWEDSTESPFNEFCTNQLTKRKYFS